MYSLEVTIEEYPQEEEMINAFRFSAAKRKTQYRNVVLNQEMTREGSPSNVVSLVVDEPGRGRSEKFRRKKRVDSNAIQFS